MSADHVGRLRYPLRTSMITASRFPSPVPAADAVGGLGFPDMPRLELDQLLVQLVDRAR